MYVFNDLTMEINILFPFLTDQNLCTIASPFRVTPFNSSSSYTFSSSCDHYLLYSCSERDNVSVSVNYLPGNESSATIGLRYGELTIISTETGEVVVHNSRSFLQLSDNIEVYNNHILVFKQNESNRIEFRSNEGRIEVFHAYSVNDISVAVTGKFSMAICGLCGRNGSLIHADLETVANINIPSEVTEFSNSYLVEPSKQYLRGQQKECGKLIQLFQPRK